MERFACRAAAFASGSGHDAFPVYGRGIGRPPIVCTNTLQAQDSSASQSAAPVALTTCSPIETTAARIERVNDSWTAPHARGVDFVHQTPNVLELAVAGPEGNRVMGFGFPDQTLIWDATAIGNTTRTLWEDQSPSLLARPYVLSNGFYSSLAFKMQQTDPLVTQTAELPLQNPVTAVPSPAQSLW